MGKDGRATLLWSVGLVLCEQGSRKARESFLLLTVSSLPSQSCFMIIFPPKKCHLEKKSMLSDDPVSLSDSFD